MGQLSDHIHKFLDCSTANITKEDSEYLNNAGEPIHGEMNPPFRIINHEYGYFINVTQDADLLDENLDNCSRISEALKNLVRLAHKNKCWWINIDQDAEPIYELPIFEW